MRSLFFEEIWFLVIVDKEFEILVIFEILVLSANCVIDRNNI